MNCYGHMGGFHSSFWLLIERDLIPKAAINILTNASAKVRYSISLVWAAIQIGSTQFLTPKKEDRYPTELG
jgi:hypothetical protein